MKTITELEEDKKTLLEAINILDEITEQETGKKRTDEDFTYYESWATSEIKQELNAKIGEIIVQIGYTDNEEE